MREITRIGRLGAFGGALVVAAAIAAPAFALAGGEPLAASRVTAAVETAEVPSKGDAADDPAIWVNPSDPSKSAIIGTDKRSGIAVYDLDGRMLGYRPDGRLNNVDLRDGFPLGGKKVTIVAAGNRSDNSIALYRLDPSTRELSPVAARKIQTTDAYGACLYRSVSTGKFYYFVSSKAGAVEQWELFDNGSGKVDARKARDLKFGSTVEGLVADDELGHLYVGEEQVGIWKLGAEPTAADTRKTVDRVGAGRLVPDVEGLAIAYLPDGAGHLVVSSQGNNTFVVYDRKGDNAYVKTFSVVDGNGVDAVSETDGIDVTSQPLGDRFPKGLFVAQDGLNDRGNQNFKLVRWDEALGR